LLWIDTCSDVLLHLSAECNSGQHQLLVLANHRRVFLKMKVEMKKNGSLNVAATQQQAGKSSNWRFGWSASSVNAEIAGRRLPHDRLAKDTIVLHTNLASKISSSW